jgi:predicted metalloprotease
MMQAEQPERRQRMRWIGRRKSSNVSDQRGVGGSSRGGKLAATGGIGLVVAVVLFLLTGNTGFLGDILGGGQVAQPDNTQPGGYTETAQEKQLFDYVSVTLADIEDTWNLILPQSEYKTAYVEPKLVVYSGYVDSGCGAADSGVGPFYCTADQTIYLDLSFYDTLVTRYGAKAGDFAMTYVIAHEAGHHVQTLQGVTGQMNDLRQQVDSGAMTQTEFNRYSVAYELQADYLAGVVAFYMQERGYLENGDLTEAMSAAAAVGDDAIQVRTQGYADPDTFNHGTSAQRQEWFQNGYQAGDLSGWDTFKGV